MTAAAGPSAAPDRLFGPRAGLAEVQARSVGAGLAIVLTSGANRIIRFAAMLILARLLTPADFGVFAVVMGFAGMAGLLYELGLATATVQRATIAPQQVSTLFWINVGLGAVACAAGVLAAPALGRFYGDPRIATMCALIAFSPLLASLGLQHLALLQRALQFRQLASYGFVATVAGTLAALLLAWRGAEFVALAAGLLVTNATMTALGWWGCRWRPTRPRIDAGVREMLAMGAYLVGFGALGTLAEGLHSMLLGKLSGVESAGLYFRASSLAQLVNGFVLGAVAAVATSALSHLKDRPEAFRHYYLRCAALLVTLCAPAAALGWLFAAELVAVIFGPQWDAAAPLFAILCLGSVSYALCFSTGWIYVATGNVARMMRWGLIGWPIVMIATLIGAPRGLEALAIAQAVALNLMLVPCLAMSFHGTPVTWRGLIEATWRPLAAALLAAAATHAAAGALPASPAPRLFAGGVLFTVVFLVLLSEAFGQRRQLVQFARQLFGRFAPGTGAAS